MGYTPLNRTAQSVGDIGDQRLESIELNRYAPPSGSPPESSKNRDSKAYFLEHDKPSTAVRHWPVHSQQVARLTPLRSFIMFFDAILASTPIMFIVLALIAARLDGKDVSAYGTHLRQTLLLSPTIFPVIFACLMGRCFKHIGLYYAERGITLGRLEQLVGCQSLFSALERQIALPWSVLGVLMTFVWFLSPLGGQSALRLLDQEKKYLKSTGTVHYLNPLAIQGAFVGGASAMNSGRSTYTSVFLAALLSSSKYQATPMDLWGNVKMPAYSSLKGGAAGFKDVDYSQNVTYASLIGIPVAGVQSVNTTSTYSLKTRQWDVTCENVRAVLKEDANFGNATATWKLRRPAINSCPDYPCKFNLTSQDSTENFTVADCQMTFQYVEARISCNGTSCRADSMQKLDLLGDAYTQSLDDFTRSVMIANELNSLPTTDNYGVGSPTARGSTNMEKWMYDPWNFIGATFANVDLWKLPAETLGERLTIIINTFWQSTYATTTLGGNLPKNLTELANDFSPNLTFNETKAAVTLESTFVYKTNWKWFVALLVSSIVLQIAAYAGLFLRYITLAPDIIGYASSLTFMNPYIPTPTGGTTLHGLERSALLHDLKIRIGDVCANEPVGAISVAKADEGRVGRLDRRRWYI
ncbi:hypothetical protein BCR34DRAFT_200441 [Clohesyomyces aquaticus]|uniref:Uncharacterized protein n=1 Tax=Clohesyomyces aquaticus TaxID=1231657 RepID=A0A1Y1YC08_9PLEO|nr:hypothetical protein BCR34DRAFT_200441 [Clohesyomyces aquaticus]